MRSGDQLYLSDGVIKCNIQVVRKVVREKGGSLHEVIFTHEVEAVGAVPAREVEDGLV